MYTDLRLKIRHFFRKNAKIIFIVICVWAITFIINMFLKSYEAPVELQTTYKPHTSVMDEKSVVPQSTSNPIEEMIEKYMAYCNDGNWQAAYNMLSPVCQEYSFNNDILEYMQYVASKMPTPKKYAIQDYSNDGNLYIYQIKYTDDMLATGLTNTMYQFTEEKMIFKKQRDGNIQMAVGNFVDYGEIKNIFENEYLKVDVKSVVKYYSVESYTVKFTNRSDYTIVIADNAQSNEAVLMLKSQDIRKRNNIQTDIVLKPKETITLELNFQKFYDNDDDAKSLTFNAIRVMENYSGIDGIASEVVLSEIQNAISKFSVNIPVEYKD